MTAEKKGITAIAIAPPDKDINQRAASTLLFLPNNWPTKAEEYVYASTVQSVVKLLKQNNVPAVSLNPIDATTSLQDNRGLDWIAPTILISGLLLTQNPSMISVALSIIANYVTEVFKGLKNDPEMKLDIIQTSADEKKAQRVHYEGPVSGLQELEKILLTFNPKE